MEVFQSVKYTTSCGQFVYVCVFFIWLTWLENQMNVMERGQGCENILLNEIAAGNNFFLSSFICLLVPLASQVVSDIGP